LIKLLVVSRASSVHHDTSTPATTKMASKDLEERIKASDERMRAMEESMRTMEERMRAAEERTRAAEERTRAMEQRMGATPSHSCKLKRFFKSSTNSARRVAAPSCYFRGMARVQRGR
jgi:chromosome segregation ATPase